MALSKHGLLRASWNLAWPFWTGDEKWSARALLAAVVALNLASVWLNVRLNSWNNDFYNALQNYDWPQFWWQFAVFGMIAVALIVVAVYQLYLRQILQIRWRRWLTERFLKDWLADQAYYRMQLDQSSTDNPDQRIAEDLDRFTSITLTLSIGLLNAAVTLLSFLFILWTLSGALRIPLGGGSHFDIPGYMVFAAILYAVGGTWLTQKIGSPLIGLLFNQQRYEADFRFSLVRLREHAESVAFYGGESRELGIFQGRFAHVVLNWWEVIRRRKSLTWFTTGYSQLAIVFPFLVAAPRYFSKEIQLGGLMQISSAFAQVQDSLSFIVTSYTEIAEYQSVVQRLSGFRGKVEEIAADRHAPQPIEIERAGVGVDVEGLDLNLPGIGGAVDDRGRARCCARSPGCGRSDAGESGSATGMCCFCRNAPICRWARSATLLPIPSSIINRAAPSSRRPSTRSAYLISPTSSMRKATGRSAFLAASSSASALPGCYWCVRKSCSSTRQPRPLTSRRKPPCIVCCARPIGGRPSSASAITAR